MEEDKHGEGRKNVISLGFVSMFADISSEMVYPVIPSLLKSLGAGATALGFVEGLAEATASVLKGFSGWISDKLRRRKIIVLTGYTLSTIVKPLIGLSTAWAMVLGLRFVDRAGKGIRTAPRDALIADSANPNELGKWFGFHRAMDTIGAVLGPLLAFALLNIGLATRELFYYAIIPGLIAVFLIIFRVKEVAPTAGSEQVFRLSLEDLDTIYLRYLAISGLFSLANFTNAFLILRASELGFELKYLPLLYVVYNLSYSLLSLPAGFLSDRIGRKCVLIISFLWFSFVYLGFALVSEKNLVWILFFAYGLVDALKEGTQRALIGDLIPSEKRGTAYGVYFAVIGVITLISSVLAGFLWKIFGARIPFLLGAGIGLVCALLLTFFIPSKNISNN